MFKNLLEDYALSILVKYYIKHFKNFTNTNFKNSKNMICIVLNIKEISGNLTKKEYLRLIVLICVTS